jgi:light-regulated signal transduction histidine kinase (bacteriophytochrome)
MRYVLKIYNTARFRRISMDANSLMEDTGYGISTEDLPFVRAHDQALQDIESNGLGLALVKSIVERHGGQVSVESQVGKAHVFGFCCHNRLC